MTHHGSPQRYDVFDLSSGGGAFEVVSDEEMARLRDQCDTGDTDDDDVGEVEVAYAVQAEGALHLESVGCEIPLKEIYAKVIFPPEEADD